MMEAGAFQLVKTSSQLETTTVYIKHFCISEQKGQSNHYDGLGLLLGGKKVILILVINQPRISSFLLAVQTQLDVMHISLCVYF